MDVFDVDCVSHADETVTVPDARRQPARVNYGCRKEGRTWTRAHTAATEWGRWCTGGLARLQVPVCTVLIFVHSLTGSGTPAAWVCGEMVLARRRYESTRPGLPLSPDAVFFAQSARSRTDAPLKDRQSRQRSAKRNATRATPRRSISVRACVVMRGCARAKSASGKRDTHAGELRQRGWA